MLDPSVSVMVSRDLDSRLTSREQAVVTDWLEQSNLPFHIIRDHPGHFYSEILIHKYNKLKTENQLMLMILRLRFLRLSAQSSL